MKRAFTRILLMLLCCAMVLSTMAATVGAAEKIDTSKIRDVYIPTTGIVNAPTVVQNVNTAEKLRNLQDAVRPQAAWLDLSSDGSVKLGDKTATLQEALQACDGKVIPILQIPDMDCADFVIETVKDNYFDLLFASSDITILKKLHDEAITHTRLVLISDEQDPQKLVETALPNGVMIVAQTKSTRDICEYLQQRFLSVMVMPNLENDEQDVRYSVDCGADFVVMDNFQTAYDMYASVTETTMVRRGYVIGHRGAPHYAPDNTVEGLRYAFLEGADAVEIDIWRTTDDRLICFHNNNLKGSTIEPLDDPEKPIIEYSYEELQQYTLIYKGTLTNSNQCKIPTLDDMLKAMQDYPSQMLVIELKDYQECADLIKPLLEKYDVADQCVFISFGPNYLRAQHVVNSTLGASMLDGINLEGDVLGHLERYYGFTVGYPASYSPAYYITAEAIRQLHCRGINVNLWTAGNFTTMTEFAQKGAMFVTTDAAEDEAHVRALYDDMSAKTVFKNYNVQPTPPTTQPTTTQPSTQPTTNVGQAASTNSFMSNIVPWFFILPAVAFVIAIFAKIYNVRKKA